jgi:hypothetical protein
MYMRRSASIGLALLLAIGQAWSRPVDLSAPTGGLGAADVKGYLEIWREIEGVGVQLGDSYLPFRYKFSSDPSVMGGIFGPGFYIPMFEARNTLLRESTMKINLPCGKTLYMWRTTLDANKFESVDKEWTGYLTGDDFIIWRDDGWKVLYHKNKLSSITTDDGHIFSWTYNLSGLPEAIVENGQTLISVETNAAGQVTAIISNGARYETTYAERPITEMLMGQVGIKELDQALSAFKYPDGKSDTFTFTLTPDRIPTVTLLDRDRKQMLYSLDPATNHIATQKGGGGNWTYTIGTIKQDFGVPPISRTDDKGKTESATVDTKLGIYRTLGADGITTVMHVFETPGPLYQKVQKIEEIDGNTTTIVYRASFDEQGRLIRKIDERGRITLYNYDASGEVQIQKAGLTVEKQAENRTREKALISSLSSASTALEKERIAKTLAYFYIHELGDPSKALALIPDIPDPASQFILRLHAIYYNSVLTTDQKDEAYRLLVHDFPENKDGVTPFLSKQ